LRHASLVLLALLAEGPRHGYDLEQVIRGRNIRRWAKIGTSTVYKTLQDLKADGCLIGEAGVPARGAGREVFSITPDGRARLSELVAQGFRSQASLYSDRIVAMAVTHSVAREEAADELARARTGTGIALEELDRVRGTTDNAMAHMILDFYTDVMIAERKAMEATARALGLDLNEEGVGIDERA
jgi:DNA-binding PadR family transcriptional regulator